MAPSPSPAPPSRRLRSTLALALIAAAFGSGLLYALHLSGLGPRELITLILEALREAGPVPFFAAMSLLPLAGFPVAAFTLAAGPAYGPLLGLPLVVTCAIAALALNVTLNYWLAARALRPLLSTWLTRLGYTLPEVSAKNAWTVSLLVRLTPGPPFFVQSYLLGLARIPFPIYLLVSLLVSGSYQAAIIIGGGALIEGRMVLALGAAALVALILLATSLLRRRLARRDVPAITT